MQWADTERVSRQIQTLDASQFVALCADLLTAVAIRNNIPRSSLSTNLRVTEPDGGLDARCVDVDRPVPRLIPRRTVGYQFKGGHSQRSVEKIANDDIVGQPNVAAGLRAGHAFVYMAAWERGENIEAELRAKVSEGGIAVDSDQIVFISGHTLARLLLEFPPLVAKFFGWDLPLAEFTEWESRRSLRNPYQTDATIDAQRAELATAISHPGSRARVVGPAGSGKTRLVLESLRRSPLASNVLYASSPADLPEGLIAHVRRTSDIECTFVVDEVDDVTASRLLDKFSGMPSGVRLVLIGLDASGLSRPDTFQIEGLDEALLVAMITSIATGLSEDVARAIARDCARSPKLAVVIATRLRADPSLASPPRFLADGEIRLVLDHYLRIDHADPGWRAVATLALLMRVGWDGAAEAESKVLFQAVGLDDSTARHAIDLLHERLGIAPLAGRYRYVSPEILADHLATQLLRSWTRERIRTLFNAMTPAMADSFARRARRLSAVLTNSAAVEEVILGDQGPFQTLNDLEIGASAIVRRLAGAFPEATLRLLQTIVSDSSMDALRAARNSRRDLVGALEELLWSRDTFARAANLLLKLAVAENETWANNATGIWIETFQMVLGRTEADGEERAAFLSDVAKSTDPKERELAARALQKAFRVRDIIRMGMPPSDVQAPSREWRPRDAEQWAEILCKYLGILAPLFNDSNPAVRVAAGHAFADCAMAAIDLSTQLAETWASIAFTIKDAEYAVREPVIRQLDRLAHRKDSRTSSETAQKRRSIVLSTSPIVRGQDFASRFRHALSEVFLPQEYRSDDDTVVTALVDDGLAQPAMLQEELTTLLDSDHWNDASRILEMLGSRDKERQMEPWLRSQAEHTSAAAMWLAAYDLGHATLADDPEFLDRRAHQLLDSGLNAARLFDYLLRIGATPQRARLATDLIQSGSLSASNIRYLAYGDWPTQLSRNDVDILLTSALTTNEGAESALIFLSRFVTSANVADSLLQATALTVLVSSARSGATERVQFEWARLASQYVKSAPEVIADSVLRIMAATISSHLDDELARLLRSAWDHGDKRSLFHNVFASFLVSDDAITSLQMRRVLVHFPLADIGTEALIEWIAEEPGRRAPAIAAVVGPPEEPSDLHAELLARFGDCGVGGQFAAAYLSGTFWGPESDWMRVKLDGARKIAEDSREPIRRWATALAADIERGLRRAISDEAEERFR
jgi:hypothetical protein